jgi:serine/threonine protein kinase
VTPLDIGWRAGDTGAAGGCVAKGPKDAKNAGDRSGDIIPFVRRRDYVMVRRLGKGACGETVLLHDDQIGEDFVCKKYVPYDEAARQELFANFIREIKLLHSVHHDNLVRVFNYYVYPAEHAGFILMEYVDGASIDAYLAAHPDQANSVFIQTLAGFAYLEGAGILHRDIRPMNVLVRNDGRVKIIDLGFGKRIETSIDFDKSISLNWWCVPPPEFKQSRYDFATEVYFVGKLFEAIISDNGIETFEYPDVLRRMCAADRTDRFESFAQAQQEVQTNRFREASFSEAELEAYRSFADAITYHVTRIENGASYVVDAAKVIGTLQDVYNGVQLEERVPDSATVLRCLIQGTYYYRKEGLLVDVLRNFIRLLKGASNDKAKIILGNLHTRLDSISRYEAPNPDDIPF